MCIGKFTSKYSEQLYVVFRIVVGVMFFMHGLMKFGIPGGQANAVTSLMGVAGIVEILVGLGLIVGMFSRLAAIGGIITMLVGYFMVHFPQGFNPLVNKGELALLYLVCFLVILGKGNGKASLEQAVLNKEMC